MNKMLICAGALSASLAFPAFGAVISVNSVTGSWGPVVGGDNVTGQGTNEIRWGVLGVSNVSGENSGYRFDGAAPAAFNANVDVPFTLGDFTHLNYAILQGGGIESAVLSIDLAISIDGTPFGDLLSFDFMHNETPNVGGGNCCNDIVSFDSLATSDTFEVDGTTYTLDLTGFEVGGVAMEEFSTIEGQENTAQLRGVFTTATASVPEPGTLALLGLGLVGLGASRRRKS